MTPRPTSTGGKHDADCLRRKAEPGWKYICTCGLSERAVAMTRRGLKQKEKP